MPDQLAPLKSKKILWNFVAYYDVYLISFNLSFQINQLSQILNLQDWNLKYKKMLNFKITIKVIK